MLLDGAEKNASATALLSVKTRLEYYSLLNLNLTVPVLPTVPLHTVTDLTVPTLITVTH